MFALKTTAVVLLVAAVFGEQAEPSLGGLISSECKDRSKSCAARAEQGICYRADSWEAIFEECPDSCNQCKCGDNHKLCPVWALQNQCAENPGWMHSQCRYSCNACGDQLEDASGTYGFRPDVRPLVIALQPKKKCVCEDKDPECPGLAAAGQCYKGDWDEMFNKCPKSCSRCRELPWLPV